MHIPDGFVDAKTWISTAAVSAGSIAYAASRTRSTLQDKRVPLMGVVAAFIFAAQMINFPVAGGTSGHFLGAALAAILLGPWAAIIIMSTVLIVQLLFFGDGGVTALGANIFNMAICGVFVAHWTYTILMRTSGRRSVSAFCAAWFSVITAAALASIELAASGTAPLRLTLTAMLGWHILIGLGESLVTIVILNAVAAVRPDLIKSSGEPDSKSALVGVGAALIIAGVLSPFASALPDGLERVAEDLGFSGKSVPGVSVPMQDYQVPGLNDPAISTALAGMLGVVLTLALVYILVLFLTKKSGDQGY